MFGLIQSTNLLPSKGPEGVRAGGELPDTWTDEQAHWEKEARIGGRCGG